MKRLSKKAHTKLIEIRDVLDDVDPKDFCWGHPCHCPLGIAREQGVIPHTLGALLPTDSANCLDNDSKLADSIFFGRYRMIRFRTLRSLNGKVGLKIAKRFLDRLIKKTKPPAEPETI